MGTSYEKIYENVLPKLRSWEIPLMSEEQVKECLHDYLVPAITRFHVCRKDLSDRSDEEESFNVVLSDMEIEILSNYLLIEYIDSEYIRTPTLLKSSLSSSDFNTFSSANMLDKLMAMHKTYLHENDVLLSRYSWFGYKDSGISLSIGYNKQRLFCPNNNKDDDIPNINIGQTVEGAPFSKPNVKDADDGDDVVLEFTLPSVPDFKVESVHTVASDVDAGVQFVKNEADGVIEVTFDIPKGQDGESGLHQPVDNNDIDSLF